MFVRRTVMWFEETDKDVFIRFFDKHVAVVREEHRESQNDDTQCCQNGQSVRLAILFAKDAFPSFLDMERLARRTQQSCKLTVDARDCKFELQSIELCDTEIA